MPSPWLAVGAETDPLVRARQLQRSWERLLAEDVRSADLPPEATTGLRPTIVESWRRSLATGLDPTELLPPIEADESEMRERWLEHPLGSLAHVLAAQLRTLAEESRGLVVVADASGLILHMDGAERLKERGREMNFLEGARLSEAADGTNGIGTPLAADHPLQVFASEHFNQRHHPWICSGAPVHDPVSGRTVGVVDLSSPWRIAHPRSLELVSTAVRTMERCLLDTRHDQDARLRRRYTDFMTRSTDLLINRDGYVLDGDGPRQATPLELPEDGGEIVLDDGSAAVAEPLGHGEAYLLRRRGAHGAKSASVKSLQRAERLARELATEQAALRQVATLVAHASSSDQLFAIVAEQAARIFDVPLVRLVRYEPNGSVVLGSVGECSDDLFPIGSRWPLDRPGVIAAVRESGRPARVQDDVPRPGRAAAAGPRSGMRSAVASPIAVEGRVWGAMVVASRRHEPLSDDTEARLTDFTELVATAIANAESRAALGRLAQEQAALRRVATLVARGVSPDQIFSAVSIEVGQLFGSQAVVARFEADEPAMVVVGLTEGVPVVTVGTRWALEDYLASTLVYRTGRPARNDHTGHRNASGPVADSLREMDFDSTVAAPIVVEGRVWGVMTASDKRKPLPPDTEERLARFTELVATAIANGQSRSRLAQLAGEQAALRRVATMVARGASPSEVFSLVCNEVGHVFGSSQVTVGRYEPDGSGVVFVASLGLPGAPVGTFWPLEDFLVATTVYRTGRSARRDQSSFEGVSGPVADSLRGMDVGYRLGAPIVVEGELWGVITVNIVPERLPSDAEERVAKFTELVATAIANAESRAELATSEARARELAKEQAALRRVATLVAKGGRSEDVFAAVANEIEGVFDIEVVTICRCEPDGFSVVSSRGMPGFPAGSRWSWDVPSLPGLIYRTGRPARIDDFSDAVGLNVAARDAGVRAAVGVPILVAGSAWGSVCAASTTDEPFSPDAEERLGRFTDLVATSISNAIIREELAASRARVVAAADDARRRIERDLHDGAQQRLVTLAVALRRAQAKVPPALDELQADVNRVVDGLTTALQELRELSRGIHPSILTEGGLSPALKALGRRSAVRVKLDVGFDQRLPDYVEVAAYYTVLESLTNASKHATAMRVWISLRIEDDILFLSIRDDGVGGADPDRGSGLTGLMDRIDALGGDFTLESPPGSGTRIEAQIPIFASLHRRSESDDRPSLGLTPAPSA